MIFKQDSMGHDLRTHEISRCVAGEWESLLRIADDGVYVFGQFVGMDEAIRSNFESGSLSFVACGCGHFYRTAHPDSWTKPPVLQFSLSAVEVHGTATSDPTEVFKALRKWNDTLQGMTLAQLNEVNAKLSTRQVKLMREECRRMERNRSG